MVVVVPISVGWVEAILMGLATYTRRYWRTFSATPSSVTLTVV